VQNGDAGAFEVLIAPFTSSLHAFIRRQLRSTPHVTPDEVFQDVIVTGWRAMNRYIEAYRFRNYIFGIAREVVRRRKCERVREIPTDWAGKDGRPGGDPPARIVDATQGRIRALVGADRIRPTDIRVSRGSKIREMLTILLGYGGYPHQQLAFCYSTTLWGRKKNESRARRRAETRPAGRREKVPITGDPDRVVKELSSERLQALADGFRAEIEMRQHLLPETLDEAFRPLDFRLGLLGRELFAKDKRSARLFAHLSEERIGRSMLRQYFGKDPRKSVADWTDRVKERVRSAFLGELDLAKSLLPWPADYENGQPAT
jgi:DNA-directed RNA polymerase specialized sigma24 family protein